MTTYQPKPIPTDLISLSTDLEVLQEKLAQNVHDHWALSRIEDGWTFGSTRNDSLKQHPCLVPFDQLPESEKEYDRKTAMETLKVIQLLGFRIISQ